MRKRPTKHDGTKLERRQSQRFSVSIPIEVSWAGPNGEPLKEAAVGKQVNRNGGHLEMTAYPEIGTRISVMNLLSAESAEARVLATPDSREGVSQGIIIELVAPSDSFWGVNLQVKKTNVELRKLEKTLITEAIDLRLLKEFRDASDYVDFTARVVHRLREVQLRAGDAEEVYSLLAVKRFELAKSFCLGLLSDVENAAAGCDNKAAEEFFRCIEQLHNHFREPMESPRSAAVSRRANS